MGIKFDFKKFIYISAALSVALLAGCGEEEAPEVVMERIEEGPAVDGSAEGYPQPPLNIAGVEVHFAQDGTNFYVHARAESEGWIAVGFNQRGQGMDGANMMLGFVDEGGESVVRNDLGRGNNHEEAEVQGFEEAVVLEEDNEMQLEFSYPMSFPEGSSFRIDGLASEEFYSLIAAVNVQSEDLSQVHSSRDKVDFRVE